MKPSDYYFYYSFEDNLFCIVEKTYWHNHNCLNDTSFDGELDDILPDGFDEVMESCFEYVSDSHWVGREKLIEDGFTEMNDPEA